MRKIGVFLFLIGCFHMGSAQYTELINSKRPGFSDSPFSVGTNVYQVEAGLFYKDIGNYLFKDPELQIANRYSSQTFGTDVSIRVGKFLDKLELDLDMAFVYESRDYSLPQVINISKLGLSKLTIGAKYLVYMPTYEDKSKEIRSWKKRNSFDKKRLIPAVGIYAGLNTNFLTELYKNPDGISPRFAVFTQNNLSGKLIVLTNLIADNMFTAYTEYSFIATTTYSLSAKVSVFGEGQVFQRKDVPNDYQFGIGGAYLLNKDMQVDGSARFINDERGDHTFLVGMGFSWRLDKHEDQFKLIGSNGDLTDKKKEGNFFSRLLGKNKTAKQQRDVKTVKAKKRKVKKLKPKKSKKQIREEQEAKKRLKESKKKQKKEKRDYNKNYEPPKKDPPNDNG
jgi:hypothetical protein